ncbi:hypothetical protein CDD81_4727 [Ophiocordyceps australis]|uniref:Peroxisomal membrane protein PEX16 n=1 Tax=Ophiocordyceps australis TaxID=1399860 RepID=A0A2C5YA79_9HYPO|nr:hypothetical protein CDD81_4727 [Ophiocordyceps australis]
MTGSSAARQMLSMPSGWLAAYDDYITRNASQVSQMESALRSLTYIIPGRFRDAEMASESIHSSVQLLSLYHDVILARAAPCPATRSPQARYTSYWARTSSLYRRAALLLQVVSYTQLLLEMGARRRGGERARWRVVVLVEAAKAACRVVMMRATRARCGVWPPLPERETGGREEEEEEEEQEHKGEWVMPRTGLKLPWMPDAESVNGYLLDRVVTADDIKPPRRLVNRLSGTAYASEVLYLLIPLIYALALARSSSSSSSSSRSRSPPSWSPWLLALALEYTARHLYTDSSLRASPLERHEWHRRAWAMAGWCMRGAFYARVTGPAVRGVAARLPGLLAGVVHDYDYLWANYYFSTSP